MPDSITDKQLNSLINLTDKQLNSYQELEKAVKLLPVTIDPKWKAAVADHIKHFNLEKVYKWALIASTKRDPERYFMTILRRQRYGK